MVLTIVSVGPIVTSDAARKAELDVSLLERLFDRPVYSRYRNAVPQMSGSSVYRPFKNLVRVRPRRLGVQ